MVESSLWCWPRSHTERERESETSVSENQSISMGMNQVSSSSSLITKSWVIDFSLISTQAVSFRVSRCSLWLILLEGSRDNWNIPCITCQRGWKQLVIYNNRPLEVMFLSLPPVAESSLRSFSLSGLRSVAWTRVGMDFILFPPSWPPKWTPFKKKGRDGASGIKSVFIMTF